MRVKFRRFSLPVCLALMVVAFACGSTSVAGLRSVGSKGRWVVLFVVLGLAFAAAVERRRRVRDLAPMTVVRTALAPLLFASLALLSTAWSVAPKLTFERGVSLSVLFAGALAIAYATYGRSEARRGVLVGLGAGAGIVGVIGLVTLAVDHDAAVQPGGSQSPWRYRGFTENPNTISLLAAVALPIVGWLALSSRGRERLVWLATLVLLLGSTIASESRGGLLGGVVGLAIVVLVAVRPWQRQVVALVSLAVVLVGGTQLRAATNPTLPPFVSAAPKAPTSPSTSPTRTSPSTPSKHQGKGGGGNSITGQYPIAVGDRVVPLRRNKKKALFILPRTLIELPRAVDEQGNPLLSVHGSSATGSGRLEAWKGALRQAVDRPLLGYGFGTEQRVFQDHWYYFDGGTPENSFLGILLQLGLAGLALIAVYGVVLIVRTIRGLGSMSEDDRGVVAAGLGVLGSAIAVMLIQSYLYSVGNVATATVWICVFLLGAVVLRRGGADASG